MRNDRLLEEEEGGWLAVCLYVDFRPLRLQESFAAWNLELRREEARFMRQQLVNGRMRKAARREGEREGADNRQRCN